MTRSGPDPSVRSVVVCSLVAVLLVAALPAGGATVGDLGAPQGDTYHGSIGPDPVGGAGSAAVADGDRGGAAGQTDDSDAIRLRNELFETDEPGTVGVTTRAEIPDRVTELRVTLLSANGDAVDADGFERADDARPDESAWEWDGETATPSLTYATDANVSVEESGPLAGRGTYRFVDAGEWALVRTPRTGASWSYTGRYDGQVGLTRENVVDGEGVASQAMAFFGPYEERVRETDDQRYRLIVPEAADAEATPEEVFDAFESASTALRVGARDETVFAVVAPTDRVEWGARGIQIGDADLWVRDVEPAGTAADVWTHEYVHTRQAFSTDASGRWITEAGATYYAALFALDRGAADFEEFERTLARGERDPDASAVLANPGTWEESPDYTKGALVAGEIDRRLRVATDGGASLATVFRELNAAGEPITNEAVLDAVEAAAAEGADDETAAAIRAEAERLTTTRDAPDMWGSDAHAEAFGETPARVGYALADGSVRATGEYRDRPVAVDPIELVAGERLALAVDVTNTGGAPGEYSLSLTVDGESVATRDGAIEAGAKTTAEFEHGFSEPGTYELRVGGERLRVVVSEPALPSVRDVSVDVDRVSAGESVRAIATVGNDAALPAGGDVEFRVDGETVATTTVRLDAGAEKSVERSLTLGESESSGGVGGDREVSVSVVGSGGEASTTVTVEGTGPVGGVTDGGAPGFGLVAAVIALLSAAGLFGRRERSG